MRKKGSKKMPTIVRCPKCNGRHVLLVKEWTLEGGIKNTPIQIKLYKCETCGKSFRTGAPKKE